MRLSSINAGSEDQDESAVVEMASLQTRNILRDEAYLQLQSTGFNSPATPLNVPSPLMNLPKPPVIVSGAPMEETSDREELSCASTASGSSSGPEEHRILTQSLVLDHTKYCSFSTVSSDSDLSYSTLEEESSYYSTDTSTDTRSSSPYCEEDYSDDGHYNLIQLPESRQDYWAVSEFDSDEEYSSAAEIEYEQEKQEFCVQCHAWPEVTDCTGTRS